jgi:hypothetical protein
MMEGHFYLPFIQDLYRSLMKEKGEGVRDYAVKKNNAYTYICFVFVFTDGFPHTIKWGPAG